MENSEKCFVEWSDWIKYKIAIGALSYQRIGGKNGTPLLELKNLLHIEYFLTISLALLLNYWIYLFVGRHRYEPED